MKSLFPKRGRRLRQTVSAASLALVTSLLVVMALNNDGDPITEVTFNDGSVWVTNNKEGLIGRLNPQIQELDLGLEAQGTNFDVKQRGINVFSDGQVGPSGAGIVPIDVAKAAGGSPTELPNGSVVSYNADVFVMHDPSSGRAWVQQDDALTSVTAKGKNFAAENVVGSTVGSDGTAYLVHGDGSVTAATFNATGVLETEDIGALSDTPGSELEVTAVGDTVVVLDVATSRLLMTDHDTIELHETDTQRVHLQMPSPQADNVIVGTSTNVLEVPLDGSQSTGLREQLNLEGKVTGEPAPPVVVDGCVYAAWADVNPTSNYLRDCPGTDKDDAKALEGEVQSGASLLFRVNRQVVVLNDTYTGDTWLVQQPGHTKVTNWDSINPEKQNKPSQKQVQEKVERKENRPPVATDDKLSARAGKASILPIVARNDHDPDGDIITIKKVEVQSGGPDVQPKIISGGTQLQVTINGKQSGQAKLKYTVEDGNAGQSSAYVYVDVLKPSSKNRKPEKMDDRDPRLKVVTGKSSSLYLLADFEDPDGDDLLLTNAVGSGGVAEYRPDGTIKFTDNGDGGGNKSVSYSIEDGNGATYSGKLPIEVSTGKVAPELVPDLKSGVPNTKVVVQPLLNDRNPDGSDLLLERVTVRGDRTGTKIQLDPEDGSFTFTAEKARTYYLDYQASSRESGASEKSFVRFDVTSPPKKTNSPPIAVADKAVLTPGSTTEVDLLLNDIDEDGDVLVVTQVNASSTPGVKVSVVDKRVAVVSASADLANKAAHIQYSVSDGQNSAEGSLTVTQRTATQDSAPVANRDQSTVREGTVATVAALANDSDPDGGKLRLTSVTATPDKDGTRLDIWVADDVLRFKAPRLPGGKPKLFRAIYGITDPDGRRSDAELSVFVLPDDPEGNKPPSPAPIIERAVAGQPKTIQVDLTGSDPDGDAVTFSRITSAPKRGRILETGAGWIKYEAYENRPGTDYFQLEVRDKYGAEGQVAIWVGVVKRLGADQPPVALDDAITVRPDRQVAVYVLGNDVDPDDDKLQIGEELEAAEGLNASQKNGFIHLDVPALDGEKVVTSTVGYQLLDEARQSDNALLKVEARQDAPFYAPVAQDDVVELADLAGKRAGQTVEVKPLTNDLDVDGSPDQLRVLGCRGDKETSCSATPDTLKITLTEQDQVIIYDLADGDEESADTSGVVFVRGTNNVAPTFDSSRKLTVKSGVPRTIDIDGVVLTRPGRKPSLVSGGVLETINGRTERVTEQPNQLVFTSNPDYVGPASIAVEVTDASGVADREALESIVTIPVEVLPTKNVPPTVRGTSVKVSQDSDVELDLAGLVRDVEPLYPPSEMIYTVDETDGLVSADKEGSLLTISATGDKEGTARIKFSVDDREGAAPVSEFINVQVVASNRPLAKVPTRPIEAERGKRVTVDIADYAQNPYAAESKPLVVSGPGAVEGADQTAISGFEADGTRVSFVPENTGVFQVRFNVSDASDDPKRDVAGRIKVSVAAPPDQPTRPEVSSIEANSLVLSWREPNNNGAPITEYKVQGSHGFSTTCERTTCSLQDLTPGNKYTFQVAAVNEKGTGKWSASSAVAEPNQVPGIMMPPQIAANPTGRDRKLTLNWEAPENEGAPIEKYVIKWNGGTKTVGPDTSETIGGLENGTAYMFTIFAVNSAGPGTESPPSDPEMPFGKPGAPGEKPTLTPSEMSDNPSIDVSWSAPDENGDPITGYVVYCDKCNPRVLPTTKTSVRYDEDKNGIHNGQFYTFSVAAINKAGEGARGPSDSARPYTAATEVRNLRYVTSPSDRTATINFDAPGDLGGLPLKHYVVDARGGSTTTVKRPGSVDVTFPSNGRHDVTVYAVTVKGNTGDITGAMDSTSVETWGKPGMPSLDGAEHNGHYWVELKAGAGSRNGKDIIGVEYQNESGAWVSAAGWVEVEVAYGGASGCRTFRTESAASGDRKYSAPIQRCHDSEMRFVKDVKDGAGNRTAEGGACGNGADESPCTHRSVKFKGEGFPRDSTTLAFSSSMDGQAGNCQLQVGADGNGNVSFDTENSCWYPYEWDWPKPKFNVQFQFDGVPGTT